MPDSVDSMSAFMSAIFCFTCADECIMLFLQESTTSIKTGTMASTTSASLHSTVNITKSAPVIVTAEISRSSGP